MKKYLIALAAFLAVTNVAYAIPTTWDFTASVLRPLQSMWGSEVRVPYITATSTASSTLPNLTATNLRVNGLFLAGASGGTNGQVLQTTGAGIQWVATSSLGISGSTNSTTSADLSEFGANSTDGSDDLTAIQAAIEWSNTTEGRVTCTPGTYLLSAPLEIPANATYLNLDFDTNCRFQRTFTSTGIDGMITNADTAGAADGSTRPKNITIKGGDWGSAYTPTATGTASAVTYTGNTFSFIADNLTLDGVHMNGLGSSGRFFLGGGENFRILRPVWKHAQVDSGTGGARILAGSGLVADGEIISGDDTLAAVPGENGNFGDLSLGHVVFRDMRGTSTAARFFAVGMTNQTAGSQATFTASIGRVDCVRCSGAGADYAAIVTAVDTTGQIGEVNIIDSELTDVSPTNGSLLYGILVDGGTGLSRNGNMGVGAVRIVRTRLHNTHGTAFQQIGEVGTIELDSFTADAPREAGAAAIIARQAERMTARNVDVSVFAGENGYQIGTNTAGEEVKHLHVDGGVVRDVYHSGASTVRYGFNLVKTGSAIFTNRPRVEVATSSIYVRYLGLSANTYNTNVISADMREITAGTPIQDLAEGTRFGRDILTATSTYRAASVLTAEEGGTGTSTYATGDLLYASSASTLARLAIGSTGQVLMVSGGIPMWVATSSLGISGGSGSGTVYLATTSTWTVGNLARVASNGAVDSVATSSLGLSAAFTTSAALAALLSDETGTGLAVFGTNPTITTPIISGHATSSIGSSAAAATSTHLTIYDTTNSNSWSTVNPWGEIVWRTADAGFPGKTYFSISPIMDAVNGNNTRIGFFHGVNATTPVEVFTIGAAGNIGFGSSTPLGANVVVTNTGANNSFLVEDSAADQTPFVINNAGNVGIGTTSPGTLLSVAGAARVTGDLTVNGSIISPTLTSFFGTPCTGNEFLQDISDTGAFTCVEATGSGGGGSGAGFATTTDDVQVTYTSPNNPVYFGGSASSSAEIIIDYRTSEIKIASSSNVATTSIINTNLAQAVRLGTSTSGIEFDFRTLTDVILRAYGTVTDFVLQLNFYLASGKNFFVGAVQWNSGDNIDGEAIANDTIDDDSIDFVDVTLNDFTNDAGFLSTVSLTTNVTGVLPIANGGTGTTTPKIWSTTIASTSPAFVDGGLVPIPLQGGAFTITRIACKVDSGTSKVIAIEDASGNSSEDITCGTGATFDDGSITNASYTAWEEAYIDFGTGVGNVDYVTITVFGN